MTAAATTSPSRSFGPVEYRAVAIPPRSDSEQSE